MHLSVSDPGFNQADLSRLFDRFYKAPGDAVAGKGSGLGLSIVKVLVELHGGTVSADNRPGSGARITVRLPQRDENSLHVTY